MKHSHETTKLCAGPGQELPRYPAGSERVVTLEEVSQVGSAVGTGLATEYVPDSLLEKLRTSRDLALKFLLDRIDSSGKPEGGPEHHARLPWTLAKAGF